MDFMEKILKEGVVKHRQTSYALPRWKTRYVVFKISGGGRLQFIIYKDSPTSPANEVKEIPIEEYGGLSTGKVDSEKHVFNVITTNMTDSFSAESLEDLQEWTTLLQEYLGKELTFNIVIPQKQGQLKSGRGVLRIRNTGFTITTYDSPPRCMGTWQIIHIRKFGGTESFKFQTGSKCPSGELLYRIQTEDNDRVKSLFNDLSQHKPIFNDDCVGRRMTFERTQTHHAPNRQAPTRFSVQSTSSGRDSPAPNYENKEVITEAAQRLGKRDCPPPLPPNHRHSSNDDYSSPVAVQGNYTSPQSPVKLDAQKMYENISGHATQRAPLSPTKQWGRYPLEQMSDGYYNVSPPLALKKYPPHATAGSSPPSPSQDEDPFLPPEFPVVPPPPIKTVSSTQYSQDMYADTYLRCGVQQRSTCTKIEGENLVVQRTPRGPGEGGVGVPVVFTGKEEPGMYQNIDFMSKKSSGAVPKPANVYIEETDSGSNVSQGQPLPIISTHDPLTETHNYTNVDFALESAHRRPTASLQPFARTGDVKRKVSAPSLSRDRSSALSYNRQTSAAVTTDSLSPAVTSNLALSIHPKLKPSLSSHDLQHSADRLHPTTSCPVVEYYNLFVPGLPAFHQDATATLESRNHVAQVTLSDFSSANRSPLLCAPSHPGKPNQAGEKNGTDVVDYSAPESFPQDNQKIELSEHCNQEDDDEDDKVHINPTALVPGSKLDVTGSQWSKTPTPQYDHLELVRTNSGTTTTRFSPAPSPSPENLSRGSTPRPSNYDQLALKEPSPNSERSDENDNSSESQSNSPQPPLPIKSSVAYDRKVEIVGHAHSYEYIEVALKGGQNGSTGGQVPGPEITSKQSHNSNPWKSDSASEQSDQNLPSQWLHQNPHEDNTNIRRIPSTHSRRKPLPLQSIPLDSNDGVLDTQPPHESKNEQKLNKPHPKPRNTPSSELHSSGEYDGGNLPKIGERPYRPLPQRTNNEAVVTGSPPKTQKMSPPKVPPKQGKMRSNGFPAVNGDLNSSRGITDTRKNTSPPHNTKGSRSLNNSPTLSTRTKDQSGFTVSLPVTEFQFNKPLVPPRPRVLDQKHTLPGIHYAKMSFDHVEDDSNYTQVLPNARRSPVLLGGRRGNKNQDTTTWDKDRVVYQSINIEVTEGLRRTREDVEHQRNQQIEWLEREQKLKALTAK